MDQMTIFDYENKKEIPLMKWIPCKERLPEQEGWCIVTEWDYSHQCWDTSISEFHASGRGGYGNDKVIAWMPMPEIYKEDDSCHQKTTSEY